MGDLLFVGIERLLFDENGFFFFFGGRFSENLVVCFVS